MKYLKLTTLSAVITVVLINLVFAQTCPWDEEPDWISNVGNFTTSVAFADLDNDGYLDLLCANYKYPYEFSDDPSDLDLSEIGDYLIAYRYNETSGFPSGDGDEITTTKRCIDCVAAADFDQDDDQDIAIGFVVGQGNDGGVAILWNNGDELSNLGANFGDGEADEYWQSDESFDCHCVRWVDFDCDGDLDLAALEVPGILHLYENLYDPQDGSEWNEIDPIDFYNGGSPLPPSMDYSTTAHEYMMNGTTMEFGDMDMDGDLDVFINVYNYKELSDGTALIVYKNLYGPGIDKGDYFNPDNYWYAEKASDHKYYQDDCFSAAFGRITYNQVEYIALAIGSRAIIGNNTVPSSAAGNDIFILNNGKLERIGRSDISTSEPQSVTDIAWGCVGDGSTTPELDLVAVSYPLVKKNLSTGTLSWDRGYEQVHLNPITSLSNGVFSKDIWTDGSGNNDKSTSLALADIDGSGQTTAYSSTSDVGGVIHLELFPAVSIQEVEYYNENVGTEHRWSDGDFNIAYDLHSGWVSVDKGDLPAGSWDEIRVTYKYSEELDLAVGNDGVNAVYFNGGTGGESTDPTDPDYEDLKESFNSSTYEYNRPTEWTSTSELYLMDQQSIGFTADPYAPEDIDSFLAGHPSIKRVGLMHHWRELEIFQGHYFWNWLDKNLEKVREISGVPHLLVWSNPIWVRGNYNHADEYDQRNRSSEMFINALMTRNLVNRYRPGGVLGSLPSNSYNWGDEYGFGVKIYQFENEPDLETFGFGKYHTTTYDCDPVEDLAELMYLQYQMINEIAYQVYTGYSSLPDSPYILKLVAPNFAPYCVNEPTDDFFDAPTMPYLNTLNEIDLPSGYGTQTNVLWNFCDYLSGQIYGRIWPAGEDYNLYMDNFPQLFDDDDMPLGLDQMFWGYYSEGLYDYVNDCGISGSESDWAPVMRGETAGNFYNNEKPFFIFDVWIGDFMKQGIVDDAELPMDHWYAARIAEMFAIDVYPDETRDAYLVESIPSRFIEKHDAFQACGEFLNGRDLVSVDYEFITSTTPKLHHYVYELNNIGSNDFVHFLKTDQYDNTGQNYTQQHLFLEEYFIQSSYTFSGFGKDYSLFNDGDIVLKCMTPDGNMYQKFGDVTSYSATLDFEPGELGPAMTILYEFSNELASSSNLGQTINLYGDEEKWGHGGWNLVSWNLNLDYFYGDEIRMDEILDENDSDNDWFFDDDNGRVHRYDVDGSGYGGPVHYYPFTSGSGSWVWDLNQAYYIHVDEGHAWDNFTSCPQYNASNNFTIEPSEAWSEEYGFSSSVDEWYFISYPLNGYTKLASEPQTILTGDPDDYDYIGPFHWLIWYDSRITGNPPNYPPNDLKIVKRDDGKIYVPYAGIQDLKPPIDQIGVLEPGRGYFLGFSCDDEDVYENFNWADYPGWPSESVGPEIKTPSAGIESTVHFKYKKYTHWSYPIIVDTVDLQLCPMSPSDEIGVFDGNLCVGAGEYTGEFPIIFTAWKDDIATPDLTDGYEAGNEMTFIWYDVSENAEIEFELPPTINAVEDDPIYPTHSGFGAGFLAIRSFVNGIGSVNQLPKDFKLTGNYPNPFNVETVILLELPQRSNVKIELYNVQGQRVGIVHEGIQEAGWQKIGYNASVLSSGVYFYRIKAEGLERSGKFSDVGKMLMVK